MNMNDILNQWDKIQAKEKQNKSQSKNIQVSHKKANAPTKEEKLIKEEAEFEKEYKSKDANPMDIWLRKYGVIDKDKIAEENVTKTKMQDRNYLLNMKYEASIDLHGLHQDEAEQRLEGFVNDCLRKGLKKILIIHGKGIHTTGTDPVLGETVRRFIENNKHCGMSGHPKSNAEGGSGATWVILK